MSSRDAVALYRDTDGAITQAAAELGVSEGYAAGVMEGRWRGDRAP